MLSPLFDFLKNREVPRLNSIEVKNPRDAAVLIPLYQKDEETFVILTKRTDEVEHHKGQICFPGGVCDKEDHSLWDTALRETFEEIGIPKNEIHYIGELGKVITPTGFLISPFVGYIKTRFSINASPWEIDEVLDIPLTHFLETKNLKFTTRNYFGHEYQDPVFIFEKHEIWGATGRILMDLLESWKAVMK